MSVCISSFCKFGVLAVHCNLHRELLGHLLVTVARALKSKGSLRIPSLVLCDLTSCVSSAEVSNFKASSCIEWKQQCHHDPKALSL